MGGFSPSVGSYPTEFGECAVVVCTHSILCTYSVSTFSYCCLCSATNTDSSFGFQITWMMLGENFQFVWRYPCHHPFSKLQEIKNLKLKQNVLFFCFKFESATEHLIVMLGLVTPNRNMHKHHFTHAHRQTHIPTQIYTPTHTHTHIHTHTHTHGWSVLDVFRPMRQIHSMLNLTA